jgi:hypothetical protein
MSTTILWSLVVRTTTDTYQSEVISQPMADGVSLEHARADLVAKVLDHVGLAIRQGAMWDVGLATIDGEFWHHLVVNPSHVVAVEARVGYAPPPAAKTAGGGRRLRSADQAA